MRTPHILTGAGGCSCWACLQGQDNIIWVGRGYMKRLLNFYYQHIKSSHFQIARRSVIIESYGCEVRYPVLYFKWNCPGIIELQCLSFIYQSSKIEQVPLCMCVLRKALISEDFPTLGTPITIILYSSTWLRKTSTLSKYSKT